MMLILVLETLSINCSIKMKAEGVKTKAKTLKKIKSQELQLAINIYTLSVFV